MKTLLVMLTTSMLLVTAGVLWAQEINIPLTDLRPGITAGTQTQWEETSSADEGHATLKLSFSKAGKERRLLAVEGRPEGPPGGAKSLIVRYRLTLTSKSSDPRLAVVVFDRDGGSWAKVGGTAVQRGDFTEGRISLAALRPTAFSRKQAGELQLEATARVWFGLIVDGPAAGSFEVSRAWFSNVPFKATKPLRLTGEGIGKWSVAQDPAVSSTLTTPDEGPDGQGCMKFEFTMPGHRHMYAIPHTPILPADLEGYTALRFTYKAELPQTNIPGLLVTLWERGGAQWMADPAPPASAEWTTITCPFDQFKLGGWTKDGNGKLDVEDLTTVAIGLHGTAAEDVAKGTIMATDIEFVP